MSFVNAHFVTYARDLGYHPMVAAGAFSLIGATAIIGALYLGNMSDNRGRRRWLAISYQLRLVGFVVVLLSMGVSFAGLPAFGLAPPLDRRTARGVLVERRGGYHGSLRLRRFRPPQLGEDIRDHVRRDAHRVRNRRLPRRSPLRRTGQLRGRHLVQHRPAGGGGHSGAVDRRPEAG